MGKLKTLVKVCALGTTLLAGAHANAATISFGGVAAGDSSGLTSAFFDPITGPASPFYFIETFDKATHWGPMASDPTIATWELGYDRTDDPAFPGSILYNDVIDIGGNNNPGSFDDECAINSVNAGPAGVVITPPTAPPTVGVRKGTIPSRAAAPANDETCYGYLTNNGDGVSEFSFDYSNLLTAFSDTGITYLGFYWGSVDDYNEFEFYSGGDLVRRITGSELLSELGGTSGDQFDDRSNVYVNIDFTFGDRFDSLLIRTSGIAGEFDNIVVGLSQRAVNAPGGIALFACSLLFLGLRSRMKKK